MRYPRGLPDRRGLSTASDVESVPNPGTSLDDPGGRLASQTPS